MQLINVILPIVYLGVLCSCNKDVTQTLPPPEILCSSSEFTILTKSANERKNSLELREAIKHCFESEEINKEQKIGFINAANIVDARNIFLEIKNKTPELSSSDIDWAITIARHNKNIVDENLLNEAKAIISQRNELGRKESKLSSIGRGEKDAKECLQSIGLDPNDGQHKVTPYELVAIADCAAKRGY